MLILLLLASALAADISRAPSGAVVVVRPGQGETVAILGPDGTPLPLPDDIPEMVLFNAESLRMVVAQGKILEIREKAGEESALLLDACSADLQSAREQIGACSADRLLLTEDLEDARLEEKAVRRRSFGAGAGAGGGVVLAGLLLILLL